MCVLLITVVTAHLSGSVDDFVPDPNLSITFLANALLDTECATIDIVDDNDIECDHSFTVVAGDIDCDVSPPLSPAMPSAVVAITDNDGTYYTC